MSERQVRQQVAVVMAAKAQHPLPRSTRCRGLRPRRSAPVAPACCSVPYRAFLTKIDSVPAPPARLVTAFVSGTHGSEFSPIRTPRCHGVPQFSCSLGPL